MMGIVSRIIRSMVVLWLALIILFFGAQLYAHTLEIVPPLNISVNTQRGFEQIIYDVNRQLYVARAPYVPLDYAVSPNRDWKARLESNDDSVTLFASPIDEDMQEIGTYPTIPASNYPVWTRDSQAIYILQQDETSTQIIINEVNVQTGAMTEFMRFPTEQVVHTMSYLNEQHLMLVGTATIFINLDTRESITVNAQQFNFYNMFQSSDYLLYSELPEGSTMPLGGATEEIFMLRMSDYEITPINLMDTPTTLSRQFVSWAQERQALVYGLVNGGIAMVKVPSGEITILHDTLQLKGAWSPDERWILGVERGDSASQSRLVALDVDTGDTVTVQDGNINLIHALDVDWSPRDPLLLVYDKDRIPRPAGRYQVDAKIMNIETGTIIYEDTFITTEIGDPWIGFSYEWYFARYGEF